MCRAAGVARLWVFLAIAVILLRQIAAGQQQRSAGPALTLRQVEDLVSLGVPDSAVHSEIQKRGLAFTPDSALLVSLRAKGAGPLTVADVEALIPKASQHQARRGGGFWTVVLEVQVEDAMMVAAERAITDLKEQMRNWQVDYEDISRNDLPTLAEAANIQILVRGIPAAGGHKFEQRIGAAFGEWRLAAAGAGLYRLSLQPDAFYRLRESAMNGVVATLQRRVNALGLSGAMVRRDHSEGGCCNVACRFPPGTDPPRIMALLTEQAMLELYEVKDGPFFSREDALSRHGGILPFNTKLVQAVPRRGQDQSFYMLARIPVIRVGDVRDSRPSQDPQTGAWETSFVLTQDAARRFERFTDANINNRLAIVLDGKVLEAPTIQSRISDSGRITGAASQQEASDLAINLRSGALPARVIPVKVREDQ